MPLGAGDVAEELQRRRDFRGRRQVIDHLGDELRAGGELLDLPRVVGVVLLLAEGCGGEKDEECETFQSSS